MKPGSRIVSIPLGLAALLLFGLGVSATVNYKPWGVHDLRRGEYQAILDKIHLRESLVDVPRPMFAAVTTFTDAKLRQPGDDVDFSFLIENHGQEVLVVRRSRLLDDRLAFDWEEISVPAGHAATLVGKWKLPLEVDGVVDAVFHLETNDLLEPKHAFELKTTVARPWQITGDIKSKPIRPGDAVGGEAIIFSQQFSEIVVEPIDPPSGLELSFEPVFDEETLDRFNAKSAYQVIARQAYRNDLKRFSHELQFQVSSVDAPNRKGVLTTTLSGRFLPWIAFYGPELHMEKGLEIGLVDLSKPSPKSWSFIARYKGPTPPSGLAIKKLVPDSLVATVEPIRGKDTDYRVTIKVAKDAKHVDFQSASQGFVEIVSVDDPAQSNWLPLHGVIIRGSSTSPSFPGAEK